MHDVEQMAEDRHVHVARPLDGGGGLREGDVRESPVAVPQRARGREARLARPQSERRDEAGRARGGPGRHDAAHPQTKDGLRLEVQPRAEAARVLRSRTQDARLPVARPLRVPRLLGGLGDAPQKEGPSRPRPARHPPLPEVRARHQAGGDGRVRRLLGHLPPLLPQPPVQDAPQRVAVHLVHRLRGEEARRAVRLRAGREGVLAAGVRHDGRQVQDRPFQHGRP